MANVLRVLEMARKYEIVINAELEHIERLHRIMKRPQANTAYAKELTEKLYRLEKSVNECIDRAVDEKLKALEYIGQLSGEERAIMERYYLLGENWDEIALKTYMSERRVFLLRKKAMDKLMSLDE